MTIQNEDFKDIDLDNLQLQSSSSSSSYHQLIQEIKYNNNKNYNNKNNSSNNIPSWLPYLYQTIKSNPTSQVGEVGLDNARYDPITKDIICPMDEQIQAFETQLHLAAHLNKAISIHSVRCWGIFFDSSRRVKKQRQLMRKEWKKLYLDYKK